MGNGCGKTRDYVSQPVISFFYGQKHIFSLILRLILLNKLLEDGNTLYRKNRLQEASHRYQYALKKIPVPEQQIENAGTFQQLKFNFLLNLSRCKRKMDVSIELLDVYLNSFKHFIRIF